MPASRRPLAKCQKTFTHKIERDTRGGCFSEFLLDFFNKRMQSEKIGYLTSVERELTSEAPQGSFLRPFLFCIFMKDLLDVL